MTPAVDNQLSADALVELWKYFPDVAEKERSVVYLYGRSRDATDENRYDAAAKNGDAAAKNGDAAAKNSDEAAKNGDAAAKNGDAAAKNGDAAAKNCDAAAKNGVAAAKNGDAAAKNGDAAAKNGDAITVASGRERIASALYSAQLVTLFDAANIF